PSNTDGRDLGEEHAAVYFSAQQHVSLVKHTAHYAKWHTVNSLIAPDVNPFLPSVSGFY
ncbi:unnamed protein product, partial [Staurois parvus]